MRLFKFLTIIFIAIIFSFQLSYAGYILTMVEEQFSANNIRTETKVYLQGNMMRVDFTEEGQKQAILFNKDTQDMWMINFTKGTYTKIDRKKMKQVYQSIQDQMTAAMEKMKAEMENMPPEQRAMIEQMMKGKIPGSAEQNAPFKRVVKKVASNQKINNWVCDKYEVYQDKKLVKESWIISKDNKAVASKIEPFFKAMANFWKDLLPKEKSGEFNLAPFATQEFEEIPGVPALEQEYEDGKKVRKTVLQEMVEKQINPSLFEIPKNLKSEEMMEFMEMN